MNFVCKMMNFVMNMMNFVLNMMDSVLNVPLFEQCSDEQLHNTAMFMFSRKYEKGQVIAKEGDECQVTHTAPAANRSTTMRSAGVRIFFDVDGVTWL